MDRLKTHRLDPTIETVHWGYFDAKLPARIEVESGDTVVVDTVSGWREVGADESRLRPQHREIGRASCRERVFEAV